MLPFDMRILFDQGTPLPLRTYLAGHLIESAFERGWGTLGNGELLNEAETAGFDMLVTTDQNLQYQQNLASRKIAVLVLSTTNWPLIRKHVELVTAALEQTTSGSYIQVTIPH